MDNAFNAAVFVDLDSPSVNVNRFLSPGNDHEKVNHPAELRVALSTSCGKSRHSYRGRETGRSDGQPRLPRWFHFKKAQSI